MEKINYAASWVALITPFTPEGQLDETTFKKLVQWHCESGTDGLVIAGSTGEGSTLSDDEKIQLFQWAVETAKGRIPIIANTGSNDTLRSCAFTQRVKECGVSAVMAVAPYYNCPPENGVIAHYSALAEIGMPVIAYNVPKRTGGTGLTPKAAAHLYSQGAIVAVKEASASIPALYALHDLEPNLPVFTGDDDLLLPSFVAGVVGCISVIANLVPMEWKFLCSQEVREGMHFKEAQERFQVCRTLIKAIGQEVNPIGIKCAMVQAGLTPYETLRLPLIPAKDENRLLIREQLALLERPVFETLFLM